MKKKINDAQKNALKLIELLKVKDYKKYYKSLATLLVVLIISFAVLNSFVLKSDRAKFIKSCESHNIDASIIINSGNNMEPYLLRKIQKCKESIEGFKVFSGQKLCEYALQFSKEEATLKKIKLTISQEAMVNYCIKLKK